MTGSDLTTISYEEFGARFIRYAVTTERIHDAVSGMAGRGLKIGPLGIGPAGLAGVVAEGSVGDPIVTQHEGDDIAFDLSVPVALAGTLRFGQQLKVHASVEIDLVLHARTADPLLIVIDVPPISPRQVRPMIRAEAMGTNFEWLLEPLAVVLGNEIAIRLNAILADRESVRSRVFDLAAMIDGTEQVRPVRDFNWISYAEFGKRFFRHAVTAARIGEAISDLGGRTLDVGPLKAGPRDVATVTGKGFVRGPKLTDRQGDLVSFELKIPVALDLVIALGKSNHYQAEIDITLVLTAHAADPLRIFIDVPPVQPDAVEIALKSKGISATVLGIVGKLEDELRAQVADVVNGELADPSGRIVDVAERIDKATA